MIIVQGMEDNGTGSIVNETYNCRFEVVDDFIDSLPFGKGGRVDGRSDDSFKDRKAREEGNSKSGESHDVRMFSGSAVVEVASG